FFFSSRRRHTRFSRDWSSDVCSSDLVEDDAMRAEFPNLPVEQNRGRRAERWVLVEVDEAYIHCRKHIPAMQPVAADQAWGTDDVKRKGGDYFGVRAERRGKQANTTSPVAACQSKVKGS